MSDAIHNRAAEERGERKGGHAHDGLLAADGPCGRELGAEAGRVLDVAGGDLEEEGWEEKTVHIRRGTRSQSTSQRYEGPGGTSDLQEYVRAMGLYLHVFMCTSYPWKAAYAGRGDGGARTPSCASSRCAAVSPHTPPPARTVTAGEEGIPDGQLGPCPARMRLYFTLNQGGGIPGRRPCA